MKLTKDEVWAIMYEGEAWDDETDEHLYSLIDTEVIRTNQEKSSADRRYIIKDEKTDKFYSAVLGESPWCDQAKHNASVEWKEVTPKTKTITVYE